MMACQVFVVCERGDNSPKKYILIGLSEVRALPLAAGINVGGHYFWYFNLF